MFHVTQCSCCDALAVCVHDKYDNKNSYCWRCIEGSLFWHTLTGDERLDLRRDYDQALARKDFQRELAA